MILMKERTINFAKEFTRYPGGRLRIHGPHSGEEFREDILIPALREVDKVILDLNGAVGLPSSFLDEVFGGIVDVFGWETVKSRLIVLIDQDPIALEEIEQVMQSHRA
jgi:hypothetical protein